MKAGMPKYELVARRRARGLDVVLLRDAQAVIHMSGRGAEKIFRLLAEELEKLGAAKPASKTEVEESYEIDEKFGGTVAAYLLLVRRSRNPDKWIPTLRGIIEGKYPGLPEALEKMVEAGIEASKKYPKEAKRIHTLLHPKVADALTSGVKRFVEKYVKGLGGTVPEEGGE